MRVEFAAYGDRGGSHAVLATTFDDPVVEKTLQITDLAWGLPDHLGSKPMFRGRPSDDYYVLVKTLRDAEASRSGMAASVAAFIPIAEIISEPCLRSLIDLLPTPAHIPPPLTCQTPPQSSGQEQLRDVPGLRVMTNALLGQESGHAIVWAGADSFIDVTEALWARLPPSLRRSFAFAFVCDPSDGIQSKCDIVYCPEELAGRFSGQVTAKDSQQSTSSLSMAEKYVFDESTRREIDDTISGLGATVSSFADLRRAASCHETLENLSSVSNLDATKLIRNIAILSPKKEQGALHKRSAVSDVCRRIESEGAVVIGLIRNIDFDEFGGSEQINAACSQGIQHDLRNKSVNVKLVADLINQAATYKDRSWASGVVRGVSEFVHSGFEQSASRIWELLTEQPVLATHSNLLFPSIPSVDRCIAVSAPAVIDEDLANVLSGVATNRGYPELHAVILATQSTVEAAVQSICDDWSKEDRLMALRRLCNRVGGVNFAACVENHDENEVIEVAAEESINNPTILKAFSGTFVSWRRVFGRIVELSPETVDAAAELDAELVGCIQFLLEGKLEPPFQLGLSKTKHANLLTAENRSQLWCRIDPEAAPGFLNATAQAWIERTHRAMKSSEEVESELLDVILHSDMRKVLLPTEGEGAVEKLINVFDALPQMGEHDFEGWRRSFLNSNRSLSTLDAVLLGQFVGLRGWEDVARRLADDVNWYRRFDLRPAVSQCLDLLDWMRRWQFGDSNVTVPPDEWWRELETVLTGLYTDGPSSSGVWARSGGHAADLLTEGTATAQWRHCLRELRNGFKSGELSVKSLLKTVCADYANNSTVKVLKDTCPK